VRAVVRDVYGTPDVLRIDDVAPPPVAPDSVLVRVHATSVNDYDWHLLTGQPFINRVVAPVRPKHRILGCDIAGTVDEVGRDVTAFAVGDEVYGDLSTAGLGAFAELVAVPERNLARKPPSLSFEVAAAVPQAGGLAVMALRWQREIVAGDAILINGGGGGVGTFAIQIAKALGARVTGVDAAHKLDVMLGAGADRVLDYRVSDAFDGSARYDRIVDIAAHHPMSTYRRCLTPRGCAGLLGGSIPRVLFAMAAGPVTSRLSDRRVGVPFWRPNDPGDVALLGRLLVSGEVAPVIDSVRPLDELPEAMRRFGAQQHTGKIVITV
jgi:NADPH:quinone reductase-like Zn-dependent oxidoreductase